MRLLQPNPSPILPFVQEDKAGPNGVKQQTKTAIFPQIHQLIEDGEVGRKYADFMVQLVRIDHPEPKCTFLFSFRATATRWSIHYAPSRGLFVELLGDNMVPIFRAHHYLQVLPAVVPGRETWDYFDNKVPHLVAAEVQKPGSHYLPPPEGRHEGPGPDYVARAISPEGYEAPRIDPPLYTVASYARVVLLEEDVYR